MVQIEIELLGSNTREEIFDLRNYLQEKMPEAHFVLKPQPPLPGQMSGALWESLCGGMAEAVVVIGLAELYRNLLRPLVKDWRARRKQAGLQLEIMSTLTSDSEKVHFLEDSKEQTTTFNFNYAIDTDKTFALLIGAGAFTSDFHPIPPVKGNLEDLYRLLTDKRHIGIPRENVVVSFNETHVEIQKQLLQAGRRQNVQTLLVYFAGHGHRSDVKKLTLVASDTEKMGDEVIGGIEFEFISNKVMKSSSAKQKILILDTCHSGIATQGADDLTRNFDVKGSYILASSPGDEVSYFERTARHTYFSGALIDVLLTGVDNTSEMLTLEDLYDHTREVLAEKKFPVPNAKNELNIPPSNFFIARNPSFSSDKLKWRAYNLYTDGKLADALDELRLLLKRFPDDADLRRKFEECETELSFSRHLKEANTLFYQELDYQKAADSYRKAYHLKKDAMVMEMIRQCEQKPAAPAVIAPDPLVPVKNNVDYIAFKNAIERKSYYAAWKHLIKARLAFPNNKYLHDEIVGLENKLKEIKDGRQDERLYDYYGYLDKGEFGQALAELNVQIRNDPEHPVFLKLQRALRRQMKDLKLATDEEEEPLFYRLFKTFGKKGRAAILLVVSGLIVTLVVLIIKGNRQENLAEFRQLLLSYPDSAIKQLTIRARKNDSAGLILGDYYRQKGQYGMAYSFYEKSALPAAKSAIGRMYYSYDPTTSRIQRSTYYDFLPPAALAEEYFKKALKLGKDTTAYLFLGLIARDQFTQYKARIKNENLIDLIPERERNWKDAVDNLKRGIADGCTSCKTELSIMNFNEGDTLYSNKKYALAYPYLLEASRYDHVRAMTRLGAMFDDSTWTGRANADSAIAWLRAAVQYNNNAFAFNYYAYLLLSKARTNPAFYDSVYYYSKRSMELDPTPSYAYAYIGEVLEKGGVQISKDIPRAIDNYRIADEKGNTFAKEALKRLETSDTTRKP